MTRPSDVMSVADARLALGISKQHAYRLINSGELQVGAIKGTVTVASVLVRQQLIKSGIIKVGAPNKKGTKK